MRYRKICAKLIAFFLLAFTLTGCNFIPVLEAEQERNKPETNIGRKEKPVFEDKGLQETLKGHWYYDNLTEEEQNIYNIIYAGLLNWEEVIYLGGVSLDLVRKMDSIIMSEHPELFYTSLSYGYTYYERDKNSVMEYKPRYCMTREDYEKKLAQVEGIANTLTVEVKKAAAGEYEAELAIHDYLIDTVDYYTDSKADEEEGLASFRTIYGALVEKKANCMGYAAAMSYLLNKMNIECGSMVGNATASSGKTESHEWNFVNINDNWYYIDTCWNDPNSDTGESAGGIKHVYFNLTREDMAATREFDRNLQERGPVPEATATEANYYVRNNLICETVEDYQGYLNANFEHMFTTGELFEVKIPDKEVYDEIYDNLGSMIQIAADYYNQNILWPRGEYGTGEFSYTYTPDQRMQTIALVFNPPADQE